MNLQKLTSTFWAIFAVIAMSLFSISCSDTETTDSTGFAIYYTGMTDIGPSMVGTISSPTYKGAAPSDFAITGITLNGEAYTGGCFEIDPETGKISISDTKNAQTGRYSISISCVAGGKSYHFPNIVTVKMLAAAPEGIKMTPAQLTADYGDVIDINSIADMPTSQVATEGEHISVTSYKIGSVELVTKGSSTDENQYQPLAEEYKNCFTISNTGLFSIVQGEASKRLEPAVYSISLILGTKVEETMLTRAIEVKITSKPLDLIYAKGEGKIEEKTTYEPTTFMSEIPTFKGSTDGLVFSIYSITPQTDKIKINEKTGQIYVEGDHGFKVGEVYTISVCARNAYNTEEEEGKIFNNIYTLETVAFIEPITNFSYGEDNTIEKMELARYTVTPEIMGYVQGYECELPEPLRLAKVEFNRKDGSITANKGNKLPKGRYTFQVTAINESKGNKTIDVTLNIIENPNKFTYIHYGNNLGEGGIELDGEQYQNQFRFYTNEFKTCLPKATTDYKGKLENLKWSFKSMRFITMASGYPKTDGQIRFKDWKDNQCGIVLITATAGDDKDTQVSVTVPVCVQMLNKPAVQIEYTPFVLRVNPKVGGISSTPKISKGGKELTEAEKAKFVLDYRRNFEYYNIAGVRKNGKELESGKPDKAPISPFVQNLWRSCEMSESQYGSKDPMSYYKDLLPKLSWENTLAYVDNSRDPSKRHTVTVLPNMWKEKETWANGCFMGTMTYVEDGNASGVSGGTETNPFIIWFDENYEK